MIHNSALLTPYETSSRALLDHPVANIADAPTG